MIPSEDSTYLGLDFSTQQLKAVIIDNNLQILHETQVQFDNDLPEFRTHGGVIKDSDGCTITAPALLWVKALDMLLDRLRVAGADFSKIAALSGTAQQHGSVYWMKGANKTLKNLQPSRFLHEQLASSFSVQNSPVWMDSSTTKQCRELELAAGGPQKLAEITGSTAYERFTASQIMKLYQTRPSVYSNTERISLVSSFACSLFLGDYASIDYADGAGMNILDIRSKQWSHTCLTAIAPDLSDKLGLPVPSNMIQGTVCNYFVERFDFSPECKVVTFTGDNPASLIGMRLKEGDIAISLGTSDTVFLWLKEPKTILEGHILCNPLKTDDYMALLWYLLDVHEIIPFAVGCHRINKANSNVGKFTSKEVEVRALVEGQFIAKRAHAEDLGFTVDGNTRIIATGGASNNLSILQVLADVFNAPVYILDASNSAMLGSAYQAKYALVANDMSFAEMTACLPPPKLACKPYPDASEVYSPMLPRYRSLIKSVLDVK